MKQSFQFTDEASKLIIMNENSDKILTEEQKHFNGNYLIFDDGVELITPQVKELKDLVMMVMSGVFDLYMKP